MWLDRFINMVGEEKINKLIKSTVAVIGLGGVGGHALETLVRSGIGNLVLVDNDVIDNTNLNRQLLSLNSNIGLKKTEVAKSRIIDINPSANVKCLDIFLDESNINDLFKYDIDFIVDACDTIPTKILLIKEAQEHNVNIISCMGTGNKLDPSMLEIIDIKKTTYDPIAKIIRKKLKDDRFNYKVNVVCSKEKPLDVKGVSSNSFVPATAGILCASYVIKKITNKK